ncbi:MAG TPA: paraquat-inducible protein A [Methylophaga sp.]|nr:paraquat-inducible protein A [Methylophaga sp.]
MTAQQLRYTLVVASFLLLAGFISPIMTITQLVWIDHSFSIVSGIWQLWQQDHFVLFFVVAGFSIILPIAKIILLFNLLHSKTENVHHRKRLLQLMHNYGRWAMLDVMVVAMLIVSVKLGAIASIQIHAGLYVFGFAVLLIMFITHHIVKLYDI